MKIIDRIRAMSVDEMANKLSLWFGCGFCPAVIACNETVDPKDADPCKTAVLKWLNEEVDDALD